MLVKIEIDVDQLVRDAATYQMNRPYSSSSEWRDIVEALQKQIPNDFQLHIQVRQQVKEYKKLTMWSADVGDRPEGMTLDRIDNNKGYELTNVRWATKSEQARNRRCVVEVTHNGKRMFLHEWADSIGVSYEILKNRWQLGERPPKLLEPRRGRAHDAPIAFKGKTKSPREWAEYLGVKYTTILYRAEHGLPLDKRINRKKA